MTYLSTCFPAYRLFDSRYSDNRADSLVEVLAAAAVGGGVEFEVDAFVAFAVHCKQLGYKLMAE